MKNPFLEERVRKIVADYGEQVFLPAGKALTAHGRDILSVVDSKLRTNLSPDSILDTDKEKFGFKASNSLIRTIRMIEDSAPPGTIFVKLKLLEEGSIGEKSKLRVTQTRFLDNTDLKLTNRAFFNGGEVALAGGPNSFRASSPTLVVGEQSLYRT